MLRPVLILLLVASIDQSSCQGDIAFMIDANEGESCQLRNGRMGHCRKECSMTRTGGLVLCRFISAAVVCCEDEQEPRQVPRQGQCGAANVKVSNHLVGDTDTAVEGEFPFMALVMYDNSDLVCGASIISDRFLLSAAHCFPEQETATSVRLGTTEKTDPDAVTIPIAKIHRHPYYKPLKRLNDIALIELERSIKMNSNVAPICLYTEEKELPASQDLTVIGWGKDNSEESSAVLLKGIVKPVVRSDCQERFSNGLLGINITDGHMCALGDKQVNGLLTDSCQGDSGGPLVMNHTNRFYLVGVISTGPGCGGKEFAGLYTWVSKYVEWIDEHRVWGKDL